MRINTKKKCEVTESSRIKTVNSKLLTLVHTESTAVAVLIMENLFNLLDYSSLVSISSPVYCFRFVDAFGLPSCLFEESKRV